MQANAPFLRGGQSRPDSNWRFRLERPDQLVIDSARLPGEMPSDLVIRILR